LKCQQTNGNGSPCQRSTWQWWLGVPLCDAHMRQALAGRRGPPPAAVLTAWAARHVACMADPWYRHLAGVDDVAAHPNRRPRMGEVQRGWLLDLGEPYGWAAVTKVEPVPTPRDGVPRVRVHFLTDREERPQHVCTADEPCYPYRRPDTAVAS